MPALQIFVFCVVGFITLIVVGVILHVVLANIWQQQDYNEAKDRCGAEPIVVTHSTSFDGKQSQNANTPESDRYDKVKTTSNNIFSSEYVIGYACNATELKVKFPKVAYVNGLPIVK